MEWTVILLIIAIILFLIILTASLVCFGLLMVRKPYPTIIRYDEEKYFEDPGTRLKCPFPSLTDMPTVSLSVIVPAYNEETRLPPMLDECFEYLERRSRNEAKFSYEVIVVNDGSRDRTSEVAMRYVEKYGSDRVRLLGLKKNRGKGGAVRIGVHSSRGELVLFADADGATRFSDLDKLYSSLHLLIRKSDVKGPDWKFPCIICGSRAHLEQDSIAQRAFDVELLYIAESLGIPVDEVAVYWTEIEGSKVTPVWSWVQMGSDLVLIWLRYKIGAWKFVTKGD